MGIGKTDRVAKKQDVVKVVRPGEGKLKAGLAAAVSGVAGALAGVGAKKVLDSFPRAQRNGALPTEETPHKDRGAPKGPFDYQAAGVEDGKEKSIKGKIVTFAEKHNWRWLGRGLQIQNRYGELNGNNLAAAVTLQTFLALIPLLIIATSVVGFFAGNSGADVSGEIIEYFGITDAGAKQTLSDAIADAQKSSGWTAVIGFVTLLWSALGVSAALEYAYNQAWQTSNRGIKDKAVGLGWMLGAAILFAASAAISIVIGFLPTGLGIIGFIVGIAVTFALWVFTGLVLPNVKIPWKAVVPGAIVGTLGLEVIKYLAGLVPGAVGGASNGAYGAVGAVIAIIAALFIFGRIVVYSAVTNVVFFEGKHGTTKATIEMPTPAPVEVARAGQADK